VGGGDMNIPDQSEFSFGGVYPFTLTLENNFVIQKHCFTFMFLNNMTVMMMTMTITPMVSAAFMAAMEADANERYERRKLREKEAQVIKEQGNQAFKDGDFEKALDFYNQVSLHSPTLLAVVV
jgi:hypothetical protein